jgi:phage terminase large subunit-like protein
MKLKVTLRSPHDKQRAFIESNAKRKVIRAGRRAGKTTGAATLAVQNFLAGRRVLYAVPTQEQVDRFWHEVKRALVEPLEHGIFYKNETRHIVELSGTEQRVRAKTAWDADSLRGDYADLLILDEFQLMKEDAWSLVGAPMLLDNDGDAVFIYTSKRGKNHAKKLYKQAQEDDTGRWAVFCFSSHDNPHLSKAALNDITQDLTQLAYKMEILALDIDDDPDALWKRDIIHHITSYPDLGRVVVGVDPPGKKTGAECGIVIAGTATVNGVLCGYVLDDRSLHGTPGEWGKAVVTAYNRNSAGRVIGEANYGGDMVESTIRSVDGGSGVAYRAVVATRGKAVRAEPVVALYERWRVYHVGEFGELEDEMCNWVPDSGMPSPNRVDALVWALTELMIKPRGVYLA